MLPAEDVGARVVTEVSVEAGQTAHEQENERVRERGGGWVGELGDK